MREFLVCVRAGAGIATLAWIDSAKRRTWDLLIDYHELPSDLNPAAEMVTFGGVAKFPSLWATHQVHDGFLKDYRAVLLLDDDVQIRFEDVDKLFSIFCSFDLDLAQPSLSSGSQVSWPITIHNPSYLLRFTDFVEIMAPVFSASALARCLDTFPMSISGWGLDMIWPAILGRARRRIAIIDEVVVTHAKAVDPHHGRFYQFLQSLGIDAYREFIRLCDQNGIPADRIPNEYGGVPSRSFRCDNDK